MTVIYEWDVETVTAIESDAHEEDEVLDHRHCKSFAEAKKVASMEPPNGCRYEVVLVRYDNDRRSWAYMEDGQLPIYAEDAHGNNWGKIPKKFHNEVNAA